MKFTERFFPALNRDTVAHDLPKLPQGREIPKVIHQTFQTRELPPELQTNADQLKERNPGWEHRLYDDSDIVRFISTVYGPRLLSYYERINPKYGAARADLFRYLLLYKYGGVYLDIKSTCTKPLDEVLLPGDQYLLACFRNRPGEKHEGWGLYEELNMVDGGEFQQWHIIAAPGHPFLRAVIDLVLTNMDRYKPSIHGTGHHGTVRLTGPVPYTLAIHPLLPAHPHRLVRTDAELFLSYSAIKTSHQSFFKNYYQKQTESIVKMDGIGRVADMVYGNIYKMYNFARWNKFIYGAFVVFRKPFRR